MVVKMPSIILNQEQSQYSKRKMQPYFRKYYKENREEILENARKRAEFVKSVIRCECCNLNITRGCMTRHLKSKSHIEMMRDYLVFVKHRDSIVIDVQTGEKDYLIV